IFSSLWDRISMSLLIFWLVIRAYIWVVFKSVCPKTRHTNATTVLLSHGVPIETVSRLLGHTDLKTTQIYARITNQKISSDMEILSHKLEKMEKEICDAI
ncbi:tyrosine-type recombinase/integrase, partial [Phocaeicola dorei]|uniref:tyrosine-type recombinase/integrase n=1 Tax=Phocaeicola dorei TaxID=357276 RepID=UPI002220DB6F